MTVPYTPQQNGRAECFNHMLSEKSEAMWQYGCLPPFFWQDAAETSLRIYNRQPIQLWNGKKPNLSYFRTFGCWAYMSLYPKASDLINLHQSLRVWSLLAMNLEQRDIAFGLELEEQLLFLLPPHLISFVKTGSTPRKNSENQSYLTMFRTWIHCVWCTLVSIVLGVLKLVRGSGRVRGAQLGCKANRWEIKTKGSSRGG